MIFDIMQLISILELIIIGIMIFNSRLNKKDFNYFEAMSAKLKKNYIQTLKNTIYSNQPVLERLIAFNEYIKHGGNGNCKNYVIGHLILQNKELWQSVLNDDYFDSGNENKEHYIETINEIKKRVLS